MIDAPQKQKLAVATLAIGADSAAELELSGPFIQRYAARIGADFVVMDKRVARWTAKGQ